jgi:hypothetical protein
MKTLLSDDLWSELSKHAAGCKRVRAAISYVTTPRLEFSKGDLLVCDASDQAIKGGLTSASLLRQIVDQKAEVYSYEGLHSKVAVLDDKALIGSANFSESACEATCEAVLLTDDPQIVALIDGFIEKVKKEADEVNDRFLSRIEALPVIRSGGFGRKSKKKIEVGESRVWIISTVPLSDKLIDAEQEYVDIGTEKAEEYLENGEDEEIEPIRWTGTCRFRSEAKAGDVVIKIFIERRGKRKYIEVYKAVRIVHRQDEQTWTRFYTRVPTEAEYYTWKEVHAMFKGLGVTTITPNSTRELTGKSLGILQLME